MPNTKTAFEVHTRPIPLANLAAIDDLVDKASLLENSDTNTAQILPLVAAPNSNGQFTLVDGFKRYAYLKDQGCETATCQVLDKSLAETDLGTLRMSLNKHRALSFKEKILFAKWATKHFVKQSRAFLINEAGFAKDDLAAITPLLAAHDRILEAVASGELDIGSVRPFMLLSDKDQEAFLDAFAGATLSRQTQREFLEWISELAYTEQLTINALLLKPEISEILNNNKLNWPQRIEKIRKVLFSLRFPLLNSMKETWAHVSVSANPAPKRINFFPSPFFEKNELEIRVKVSSKEEAQETFKKLGEISGETWKTLIYPKSN